MSDAGKAGEDGDPMIKMLAEIMGAAPLDVPSVRVMGDFTDRIKIVQGTTSSLVLGFARVDDTDEQVMLPFIEMKVDATHPSQAEEDVAQVRFAETMTLENAAYLLVSLASDMRVACAEIAGLASSAVKPERSRLHQTRYLLAHAARECITSTVQLTTLLSSFPQVGVTQTDPTAPKQRTFRRADPRKPDEAAPAVKRTLRKPSRQS